MSLENMLTKKYTAQAFGLENEPFIQKLVDDVKIDPAAFKVKCVEFRDAALKAKTAARALAADQIKFLTDREQELNSELNVIRAEKTALGKSVLPQG